MANNDLFSIFFGVWVAIGLISGAFFHFSRNAELKRRLWPPFIVGTSLLFLGFGAAMSRGQPSGFWFTAIPVVALIAFLNIRNVRFCDGCGKQIRNTGLFSRAEFCPKCGAKLK